MAKQLSKKDYHLSLTTEVDTETEGNGERRVGS